MPFFRSTSPVPILLIGFHVQASYAFALLFQTIWRQNAQSAVGIGTDFHLLSTAVDRTFHWIPAFLSMLVAQSFFWMVPRENMDWFIGCAFGLNHVLSSMVGRCSDSSYFHTSVWKVRLNMDAICTAVILHSITQRLVAEMMQHVGTLELCSVDIVMGACIWLVYAMMGYVRGTLSRDTAGIVVQWCVSVTIQFLVNWFDLGVDSAIVFVGLTWLHVIMVVAQRRRGWFGTDDVDTMYRHHDTTEIITLVNDETIP